MAYTNSNDPYKKVDDGIGAGLIAGSVIGGVGAAGTIYGANSAVQGLSGMNKKGIQRKLDKFNGTEGSTQREMRRLGKQKDRFIKRDEGLSKLGSYTDKMSGMSGKYKAAATLGLGAAGATIGGLTDHWNG